MIPLVSKIFKKKRKGIIACDTYWYHSLLYICIYIERARLYLLQYNRALQALGFF